MVHSWSNYSTMIYRYVGIDILCGMSLKIIQFSQRNIIPLMFLVTVYHDRG